VDKSKHCLKSRNLSKLTVGNLTNVSSMLETNEGADESSGMISNGAKSTQNC
jgi:hypothetical protein